MNKFDNPNFTTEVLEVINLYEPLAKWFNKNKFVITYMEFNNAKYEFEKSENLPIDLQVLKDMMSICLLWINSKYKYSKAEKALKAASAISKIYNMNIERLTPAAVKNYNINVKNITEELANDALTPPDLRDLEIEYLNSKKETLVQELYEIDSRLSQIQKSKIKRKA